MPTIPVNLQDVQAAHKRIAPYIRRTPVIDVHPLRTRLDSVKSLHLKLENLQVTGSFKARGAVNKLYSLEPEQVKRGIITASGGNHGLGVAYAGWLAKAPATVYLPANAPEQKAIDLENWGATVERVGEVWDVANEAAKETAERDGLAYFHSFADPAVIAGQGTVALEILEDLPDVDVLLVSIGGGGLISGISLAAKALKPDMQVIGVEAVGAPTLYESVRAGELVTLKALNTRANTLAPRRSEQVALDIIQKYVNHIVLVTDEDMASTARWLWMELGLAVELGAAAALAAVLTGKAGISESQTVCALVCGAGTAGFDDLA